MNRVIVLLVLILAAPLNAAEKRYPEARHAGGELRYQGDVPIVTLAGTPEQIGTQFGELVLKPAKDKLVNRVDAYMAAVGWADAFPKMVKFSGPLFPMFPKHNQTELLAAAKAADVDLRLLTALNLIPDLAKLGGCSTLVVEPSRSATGETLFGRNLDWPPYEKLPEFTLVAVVRPEGKRAFAAVTLPVILGVLTGTNDAGLSLAINEITASKDGSKKQDLNGMPMMYLFRQLLEECATTDDVEKVLKSVKRTTWFCLTVVDKKGGCVFEVTPSSIERRCSENACCCCTNHFRTDPLSVSKECDRYPKLEAIQKSDKKLDVGDVTKALAAVNQGPATIQSMVFEPATSVLHISFGRDNKSATDYPLTRIELRKLLGVR